MRDPASLMFLNPTMLWLDELAPVTGGGNGGVGNPIRSIATYGEKVLKMQIDAAVRQVRVLPESSRRYASSSDLKRAGTDPGSRISSARLVRIRGS